MLRRREKASRSKNARGYPVEEALVDDLFEGSSFEGGLWHETLAMTPSPVRFVDVLGMGAGAMPPTAVRVRRRRFDKVGYQRMLLHCHCKGRCTCKSSRNLTQWQLKPRDLYNKRIFEYEQGQDLRRPHRTQSRRQYRSSHWKDLCSNFAGRYAGKGSLDAFSTVTGPRIVATELLGEAE